MTADSLSAALRAADAAADRFLEGKQIPGIAYGVVVGPELVHARGMGTLRVGETAVPDADSVFRIASMTKSFTAATILSLRDAGHLRLDDPVAAFIPDLAGVRGPTADSPGITIRHLLTMTAGFPTDDPWGDRQQGLDLDAFAALLRAGPSFAWTPGTRFEYSNLGYGILGRVIAAAAGGEYREVVRERILDPLAMGATTFLMDDVPEPRLARGYIWRDDAHVEEPVDGYGALASMGGIFTSVRDLARWVGGFTDAFPPRDDADGGHPLSRASRREMQQIQVSIPPKLAAGAPDAAPTVLASGYGYGLFIADDLRLGRIVSHSGGYPGFGSNMRWLPASGLGVIVLANHRYAPATLLATELLTALTQANAVPARTLRASAATVAMRNNVERLLASWDDDLAARTFAMNVELDDPLARRRAAIERLRDVHGALTPDPDEPETATSPSGISWWLRGKRGGRVRIEMTLSPEPEPRIQTLNVTSVSEPSARLTDMAAVVVAAINAGHGGIIDLPLVASLDRATIERAVRAAAARHAPVELGPPTASTATSATFLLRSERGDLTLRIEVDSAEAEAPIKILELLTAALEMPTHAI